MLSFDKKPASESPWTSTLWEFVNCYALGKPRDCRTEIERFKSFTYDELIARDKVNLDIT